MHIFRQSKITKSVPLFAQTQKYLCHSEQMSNKKNNGILLAPIHFSADELLYPNNKCNENLHLLNISYSLVRGDFCLGL